MVIFLALSITNTHIYFVESSNEGTVLVVNSAGKLVKTIVTAGAEISGLAIWYVYSYL
jgi:hypothetical protein